MEYKNFDEMLAFVAKAYDTTPDSILWKIELAISEGQQNSDPQVRALWQSVPHTGTKLTLSEFVSYLAQTLQEPFSP